MKTQITTLAATFALFTTAALNTTAFADHVRHIDDVADRVAAQSAEIAREIAVLDNGTRDLWYVRQIADRMVQSANHVHDMIHAGARSFHLAEDVESLDRTFHQLESQIDLLRHRYGHVAYRSAYIGGTGVYHTPASGDHRLARLDRLTARMEDTLHQLRDDVRDLPAAASYAPTLRRTPTVYEYRGGRTGAVGFSIIAR